jgi:hypothetical protein
MGHTYAETFPERVDDENSRWERVHKLYNKIKNKKLSGFTVEQLRNVLPLIGYTENDYYDVQWHIDEIEESLSTIK